MSAHEICSKCGSRARVWLVWPGSPPIGGFIALCRTPRCLTGGRFSETRNGAWAEWDFRMERHAHLRTLRTIQALSRLRRDHDRRKLRESEGAQG